MPTTPHYEYTTSVNIIIASGEMLGLKVKSKKLGSLAIVCWCRFTPVNHNP